MNSTNIINSKLPCKKKARLIGVDGKLPESIQEGQNGTADFNGLFSKRSGLVLIQNTYGGGANWLRPGERITEFFNREGSKGPEAIPKLIPNIFSPSKQEVKDKKSGINTTSSKGLT